MNLKIGVLQGSARGLLLFSLHINDFPLFLEALYGRFAATEITNHTRTTDLNTNDRTLNSSVNDLVAWSELNHIHLWPEKNAC